MGCMGTPAGQVDLNIHAFDPLPCGVHRVACTVPLATGFRGVSKLTFFRSDSSPTCFVGTNWGVWPPTRCPNATRGAARGARYIAKDLGAPASHPGGVGMRVGVATRSRAVGAKHMVQMARCQARCQGKCR